VTPEDTAIVTRQLGRTPVPFLRVRGRCVAGRPIVVEQPPRTLDGAPFPTTFWLTCPGIVRAVALLESAGMISRLERRLAEDRSLAASFHAARRRQIALRPDLGDLGIGGTRSRDHVKCLHAHVAFAIAEPPYRFGEVILDASGGVPNRCCMEQS
jgi:uncharacterized protein